MDIRPVRCLIPDILRSKRKTQVWLAAELGMSKQQLNDYVQMRIMMKVDTAMKFSRVLNVAIDDLYEWNWIGE